MGVRLIALLLCVVLIATFVDTIPDPPAIGPPRIEHQVVPRIAISLDAILTLQWYSLLHAILLLASCFSILWFFEPENPLGTWSLVTRHATDVSPPHLF